MHGMSERWNNKEKKYLKLTTAFYSSQNENLSIKNKAARQRQEFKKQLQKTKKFKLFLTTNNIII